MSDLNEPKKETVRITLPPKLPAPTGNESGGSNETVRINLPARAPSAPEAPKMARPPIPNAGSAPAARPPMARPPIPTPSGTTPVRPPSFSPPRPPAPAGGPALAPAGAAPATPAMPPRPKILPPPPRVIPPAAPAVSAAASPAGPKKETARINILPEAASPAASVAMAKTQPLMAAPTTRVHSAPVNVATMSSPAAASSLAGSLESVPLPICWVIFGISSVTLLIQIWNYLA